MRELIDAARSRAHDSAGDPLIRYLIDEPPAQGAERTTVETLDRDVYG